ncbi:Methyltransferase-like protein 1 [Apostasia shenzhenica]|uniref:Methyltransferase-like protein 1 n=1 Tax=Apostasia shenzhenica TaxID=1088818 RepID=A0A2I0BAM8_9ASPA|nr:Methyltransferase-like protein 1 [Apostasia shenzhenica]
MDTPELTRNYDKRDLEGDADFRESRFEDDNEWDSNDLKKQRSNKLLRNNAADMEEHSSRLRKFSGDVSEGRKIYGNPGQESTPDDDDYMTTRLSCSLISRKNTEGGSEMGTLEDYEGADFDRSEKNRDDDNNLSSLKMTYSSPGYDNFESKERSKVDPPLEGEDEKVQDRDSRYSDRSSRLHNEQERNITRISRWDDMDTVRKVDVSYMDRSDPWNGKSSEHGNFRERTSDFRNEPGQYKGRVVVSSVEKGDGFSSREGKKGDMERKRGRTETDDGDHKEATRNREAKSEMIRDIKQTNARDRSPTLVADVESQRHNGKSYIEIVEKLKHPGDAAYGSRDEVESMEHSDEDTNARMRDKYGRAGRYMRRSQSPGGSRRYPKDFDDRDQGQSESDTERNTAPKGNEWAKDYRDDRTSKGKDATWNNRSMEWEGSKDYWRNQSKQEAKDLNEFDNSREWEFQRHEPGKVDNDKLHNFPGYKKDHRTRSDGGRFDNSDSIEIKPNKSLDFVSDGFISTFHGRRAEIGSQQDSSGAAIDEEWCYQTDSRDKVGYDGSSDLQEKFHDDVGSPMDQSSQGGKGRGQKGIIISNRTGQGQNIGGFPPPFVNNPALSSFNRNPQQGQKGIKNARGGRARMSGREGNRGGLPMHMMGPPFGHLGLPPGNIQPMGPSMPHSAGPLGPGVFLPPFAGPLAWPGARVLDMNLLAAPPNLPPIPPPSQAGPRFVPNLGAGSNQIMFFNQPGAGRINPNIPGSGFNSMGPNARETSIDKAPPGWGQSRASVTSGKAPSRGEQNDYSQNFVDTGMRPQNFIRELELTSVVEDYPKLRELIQRKDEIVIKSASPPMYQKCDLHEFNLGPEFFGTKFDVILVDPPWEEYVHRAPGITDHIEYWTFEEIQNLKIEAIADTPSFIFLWVGDGAGLEQGRQCLKKEHCLMGIKGTVRRSTDGHIIHANIDTDIIIAEEPSDGSTKKPDDMYRIIEHFALGRRRLELFGEDHNIRPGWLTLGKGLTSSNFNADAYIKSFADKDGKVWQGGGGRNPPPDAPHLVATTPEIEGLRPKSPLQKSQQSPSISLMSSSGNRRPLGSSPPNPQNSSQPMTNHEASTSDPGATASQWLSSMGGFRELEGGMPFTDDKNEGFSLGASTVGQVIGDHVEFDPHRAVNINSM